MTVSDEARRRGPGYVLRLVLDQAGIDVTVHATTVLPDGRASEAISARLADGTQLAADVRFATDEEV